jgi:hypothetical protein
MRRVVLALAIAMAACTPGNSDAFARFYAEQKGTQLNARVDLSTEAQDGDPIEFGDSDVVRATFRGETREVDVHTPRLYWEVTFNLESPLVDGDQLTVEVARDGEPTVATTIDIKPIALDPLPLFVARSKDFTFSWAPAVTDPLYWEIGYCVSAQGGILPGATSATIAKDTLRAEASTCGVELELKRRQEQPVTSGFAGGSFLFVQDIKAPFASMP